MNDIIQSDVLYEDNHLIVINKKPSEIVQGDKTGDIPLSEKVKEYLKKKYNKPGNIFCGVIHRVDRPASGVIVFAKTCKALARMNELFRTKEIQKNYWAIVKEKPERESDYLIHYLKKNQQKNISHASIPDIQGYLKSEMEYKLLCSSDNYHLLEIKLHTGRHHQIRAQLSAIGCPIKGDVKYGYRRTNQNASIHLHAREIEFIHPVSKKNILITASPPDEILWNVFMKMIGKEHLKK